ncbi:UAA transporter [Caenorhabditis elegans]|nr:UAA transporter [Caenorhabditis elegans]CDO41128.1 UAA transporter [Caenorhabditis elegans]|eukprot:NP_001294058.1 Nucleotide Sugar TransPorter family [Caenorhabditis elegans]
MTMGWIIRNYQYSLKQISAVVVVTAGIVIFTLASYEPGAQNIRSGIDSNSWLIPIPPFVVGLALLSFALILSAYLGLYQETFYQKHGKHNEEMMFYVHFLSIPLFAFVGDDMVPAFHAAYSTPSFVIAGLDTVVPSAWVYIFAICLFQFACTKGVYMLSAVTTSLNVTMVLTLRKFFSLLISFIVFENVFNMFHIIGAAFVFIGTILFSVSFARF